MKNPFLLFLVVLALFLAGCSGGNISGSAFGTAPAFSGKKLGELINDPSVQVTEKTATGSTISASLNGAASGCVGLLPDKQYLLVEASSPTTNYSVVLDGGSITCVVRKEMLFDKCQADVDCDDGLFSTADSCTGEPKVCLSQRTTACKGGDSFCPPGCIKNPVSGNNDGDCLRECYSASECDDGDLTTKDSCGGPLYRCIHGTIFDEGKKVVACTTDSECIAENVCSAGTCIAGLCSFEDKQNGTVCDPSKNFECFDGECVKATENPVRLVKTKLEWVDDGHAGKIFVTASTNKLSFFEGLYGTEQSYLKEVADLDCSSGACFKRSSIDHSIEFTGLVVGKKYYYYLIADGLSELTASKTETLFFLTCPGNCDDKDECTTGTCNISTGACIYEKNGQNPSC